MPVSSPISPHRLDFAPDQDDSAEKNRQAMTQIFLHDILNTAGGIKGVAELLVEAKAKDDANLRTLALNMAQQLVEEITAQRDLLAAESGNLELNRIEISSRNLLVNLIARYRNLPVAAQRNLVLSPETEDMRVVTDPHLLERVLSNMLINALEAEPEGATVTIGCNKKPGGVHFWVRNPGYIAPEIQSRVFDRSFSTKGNNRGLGTYSILLLSERFLQGSVGFSTDPDRGTTFHLTIPYSAP
jgi:signal transduction histidine kinase